VEPPHISSSKPIVVTALFQNPAAVEQALAHLVNAGVPRDLIEVVVSPEAGRRFFGRRVRRPEREAIRYAGAGALIGLLVGAFISLGLLALPGFQEPGVLALVQLLGPNMATAVGVLIGGTIGFFLRYRTEGRYARAAEAPDAIIVVVVPQSREEANTVLQLLQESRGQEPRSEAQAQH
jgi:hypothetical protein